MQFILKGCSKHVSPFAGEELYIWEVFAVLVTDIFSYCSCVSCLAVCALLALSSACHPVQCLCADTRALNSSCYGEVRRTERSCHERALFSIEYQFCWVLKRELAQILCDLTLLPSLKFNDLCVATMCLPIHRLPPVRQRKTADRPAIRPVHPNEYSLEPSMSSF